MDRLAATCRRIRLLPEAADERIAPASWQTKATELPRHRKRKVSGAKQAAAQYQRVYARGINENALIKPVHTDTKA